MIVGVTLIRPERPSDMGVVRELNDQAFGRPDEGRLVDAVRQRTAPTISLVAVDENDAAAADARVIGHLLFSQVTIESPTATVTAIGLGPIAVRPDRQRSGVGTELIRLLKLSGSLVHDYATISDDSPSPNRASRARRAATSAGIS